MAATGIRLGGDRLKGFYDCLVVRPNACPPGCKVCTEACAKRNGGDNLGVVIKTVNDSDKKNHTVSTCLQCSDPECLKACPGDAISKSEKDGVVRIDKEQCTGCEACIEACPYGAMYFNEEKQLANKCDMCDGKPACVSACPHGVLSLAQSKDVKKYMQDQDLLSEGVAFCAGCSLELALRFTLKVLGKDIVIFSTASCSAPVLIGTGAASLERTAFYGCLMTNVASSAAGYARYYRKIGKDVTPVCFVGDGCTADVGFQPLSGAAERNENVIYICYDNEGYMNTGYQKSSTTPMGAWTSTTQVGSADRGKPTHAKDMPLIMAMHGLPYMATATLSNLEDYAKKLIKAKEAKKHGLAYIHLFAPCTTGWKLATDVGIEVCRTAVETNYFPLFEVENGEFRFTYLPKEVKPVKNMVKLVRKFSHLTEEDVKELQTRVDKRFNRIKRLVGTNT
ncbi:MAG: thiamine pyrophosphate-dependent enzyme [Chloroflexi bacterium]|nr:thiamine pyrophosphate-dependent enzyme [Chloroflexota bacterium]